MDVQKIGDKAEGIKAYSKRKPEGRSLERRAEKPVDILKKETRILKNAEKAKVQYYAHGKDRC
jgi:hypothetical protein